MSFKYGNDNTNYKIGLYIRLSREDGDDLESESISNQRILLNGYLKANDLTAVDEYVDDGYSGGNFNRPGFQRLIRDIENKKINCVITKDLSRLGRDYIDTGRYVERYFPENNIRYIAVNDDIDTFHETSGSDMMPFKLGMNDMYAKDISKKVRSSLLSMKKEGKFCGSVPPYGYIRDPNDKYKLIPDPNTAPIVKQVFDLYLKGHGSCEIADILTRDRIPTPIMRKNNEVLLAGSNHPEIWKHSSINNILKNRTYTGCLIQHTMTNISYKTKKRKKVPEKDWCIVENAHEAIIDKETFDIVQALRNKNNNYSEFRRNVEYIFSDLVFCKDCGAKMSISYDKKRDRVSMNCSNYRNFSKYGICSSHFINYKKLEETITTKLRELTCLLNNQRRDFENMITEEFINPKKDMNKKIDRLNKEILLLQKKQDSLYDDKFNGLINADTYKRLFDNTEKEIIKAKEKRENYINKLSEIKEEAVSYTQYMKVVEDFLNMKNPTKEMIGRIFEKIEVTKDKKIEIHYRIKGISVLV